MLRQLLLLAIMLLFSSCLKENAIPISSSFSIEMAEDKTNSISYNKVVEELRVSR